MATLTLNPDSETPVIRSATTPEDIGISVLEDLNTIPNLLYLDRTAVESDGCLAFTHLSGDEIRPLAEKALDGCIQAANTLCKILGMPTI